MTLKNLIKILIAFSTFFIIIYFIMNLINPVNVITTEKTEIIEVEPKVDLYKRLRYRFSPLYLTDYKSRYINILDNSSLHFNYGFLANPLNQELKKLNIEGVKTITLDFNTLEIELAKESNNKKLIELVEEDIKKIFFNIILVINSFNYLSEVDKKITLKILNKRMLEVIKNKQEWISEKVTTFPSKKKKVKVVKEIKRFTKKNIILFSFFASICLVLFILILNDLWKYQKNKKL